MAKYHGKSGAAYISTSGTGNAAAISLTDWSLDMKTDRVDVTSFQDSNKAYVQGLKDLSGALSGFWDNATDSLFDAADSADGCKIYLYPNTNISGQYFYGPAWLDASINTAVSDAVKVSGTFAANGAWGRLGVT